MQPTFVAVTAALADARAATRSPVGACNLSGVWHGHPAGGGISGIPIHVVQPDPVNFTATATGAWRDRPGRVWPNGSVEFDNGGADKLRGVLSANTAINSSAPPCTRLTWDSRQTAYTGPLDKHPFWCREPFCEAIPAPIPPSPSPPPPPPPGTNQPNVVFILTDDQDTLLGSLEAMPIVRRELVAKGTTLTHFYVDVPVCCPSRTSYLSGRYAHNNGAVATLPHARTAHGWCGNGVFWKGPKGHHSLPVYMKSAGYVTGIFGKELNSAEPTYRSPGWDKYYVLLDECNYYGNSWADDGRRTTVPPTMYMTTAIADAAFGWIRRNVRTPSRPWPFFANIAPHAPHQPAQPDVNYTTLFAPLAAPRTAAWNLSAADHHWLVSSQAPMTAAVAAMSDEMFRRRWRALKSVDDMVGGLVDMLRDVGELDRTVIVCKNPCTNCSIPAALVSLTPKQFPQVYTSDHGYHVIIIRYLFFT